MLLSLLLGNVYDDDDDDGSGGGGGGGGADDDDDGFQLQFFWQSCRQQSYAQNRSSKKYACMEYASSIAICNLSFHSFIIS